MEEIEEFLMSSRTSVEKIRSGLKLVGEEEQQLLSLRQQLTKIKRIREEQLKKDETIAKLQETITVLEYEKATALRQNTELQEIMSERIHTLERYLQEKEAAERVHEERYVVLERHIFEKATLEEEVTMLKQKLDKCKEENRRLKTRSTSDNQLNGHFQALFDNLREEVVSKDATIAESKRRFADQEKEFKSELSSVKALLEKLQCELDISKESLARSDKMNANLSDEVARRNKENDSLQKLLHEAESMLLSFKASTQHEIAQLQLEVQQVLQENEQLHHDETTNNEMCTALHQQLTKFHSLFHDHVGRFELRHVQDLFQELKRLKRSVHDGGHGEQQWLPLVTVLSQILQLVCDKRNQALQQITSLEEKVTSVDHVATAFHAVEEKFSSVWEDAVVADSVVQGLLDEIAAAGVKTWTPPEQGVTDSDREDVILSLPKAMKKLSWNNKKITKFHSKRREKDYYELIDFVRHAIMLSKEHHAREDLVLYLQQCQTDLKDLQERYNTDIGTLQRMSDEAYLAVKVNVVESEKNYDQIKHDFERKVQLETAQANQLILELRFALTNNQDALQSVFATLVTVLSQYETQEHRYRYLVNAYRSTQNMVRGYERLARNVKNLAISSQVDSSPSRKGQNQSRSSRPSLRVVAISVVAMVHWRFLAKSNRNEVKSGPIKSDFESTAAGGQHLRTTILQPLLDVGRLFPVTEKSSVSGSSLAAASSQSTDITSLCQTTQRIVTQLGDWGLLHQKSASIEAKEASLVVSRLFHHLQTQQKQKQKQLDEQVYHQQKRNNSYNHSLLRLLAKPTLPTAFLTGHHSASTAVDMSFDTVRSEAPSLAPRRELFGQMDIAHLQRRLRQLQQQHEKDVQALEKIQILYDKQQAQQKQSQAVASEKPERLDEEHSSFVLQELQKKYAHDLFHAVTAAKEEERQRQMVSYAMLEQQLHRAEEQIREILLERDRLTLKLHKAHDILRATASHALEDLYSSPSATASTFPAGSTLAGLSSHDSTASTALQHSQALHRENSRSSTPGSITGISVSSSTSTAARYQPQRAAITSTTAPSSAPAAHNISNNLHATSDINHQQAARSSRYQYMVPEEPSFSSIASSSVGGVSAAAATAVAMAHRGRSRSPPTSSRYINSSTGNDQLHVQSRSQVVEETSFSTAAGHSRGSDVSPEMQKWTTSSLWQDQTFMSDPSMSALLSQTSAPSPTAQKHSNIDSQQPKPSQPPQLNKSDELDSSDYNLSRSSEALNRSDSFVNLRSSHYRTQLGLSSDQNSEAEDSDERGKVHRHHGNQREFLSQTLPMTRRANNMTAETSSSRRFASTTSVLSTSMDTPSKSVNVSSSTLMGYTPDSAQHRPLHHQQHQQRSTSKSSAGRAQSDRDLQEIFADIGRLTVRLETRLGSQSDAADWHHHKPDQYTGAAKGRSVSAPRYAYYGRK